jgi:tRNA threonylcarbamoyladenosine biosynthesis protein TsaB
MSLILHIDTALGKATVSLAKGDVLVAASENPDMRDQAAWIHTAIQNLLKENGYTTADVSAIAVVAGPGSYTGLRIGLATGKGLCYALQVPLIMINTLELITASAQPYATDMICAMIDARRMEVFAAVYNKAGETILAPAAKIINENSFSDLLSRHQVLFAGNSNAKVKTVINHPHAFFLENDYSVTDICILASHLYKKSTFTDLAYAEPYYFKEHFTISGT